MTSERTEQIVHEIFSLYEIHGQSDYIGENISQLEHMCQSAVLAEEEGFDDETILAAFFHDIGHLFSEKFETVSMNGYGIVDHELIAGRFLRDMGFSEKIARLVEMHVQTKRYLTFRDQNYYDRLSEASRQTLDHQGGKMNENEATIFEQDDLYGIHLKIREWDDKAKIEGLPLPSIDRYRKMAFYHLLIQN